VSQILTTSSLHPAAINLPSRLYSKEYISEFPDEEENVKFFIFFPEPKSHIHNPEFVADTMDLPSGEMVSEETGPVCPLNIRTVEPFCKSHNLQVLSYDPVAI
jgi:hypothetical protein